jgi:DNA-binding transcriptional regulator YdaS (Cro superfamily)
VRPRSDIDLAFIRCRLTSRQAAAVLGVTYQCVNFWRRERNQIPPAQAKALNQVFGLPLHVLRPDIWDPPARRRKAA